MFPLPGEYYALVRIFFCGLSLYYLSQPVGIPEGAKLLLVALAVLHNPIVPIELGNGIVWAAVNTATVGIFWIMSRRTASASRW